MSQKRWDEFVQTLQFRVEPGTKPVPKPTPKDFDAYEAKTGFKLPESYRGLLLATGPGRFVGEFNIAAPGNSTGGIRTSLEALNVHYHKTQSPADLERYSNDVNRALRLHVFSFSEGTLLIGWDPQEVTDPNRHEYGIYELDRLYKVNRLADTFHEFIEDFVLGDGYLERIGGEWDEDDFGPRREFQPAITLRS